MSDDYQKYEDKRRRGEHQRLLSVMGYNEAKIEQLKSKARAFDWLEANDTNISIQYYIGGKSIGVTPDKGITLVVDGDKIYYGESILDCVQQAMEADK